MICSLFGRIALLLVFLTGCFSLPVPAQDTLTADIFFRRVLEQLPPTGNPPDRKVRFPLIEKYEFRTETDEMEFDRQEYAFRISPSTLKKKKTQTELFDHLAEKPGFANEEEHCDKKTEVNIDWLYLYYHHRRLALLKELEVIYQDRQVIAEQRLINLQNQDKSLIEEEINRNDLALEIFDTQNELDFLRDKYALRESAVSFAGFLAVEDILDRIGAPAPENSINRQADAYELAQIDKEIRLEQAEQREIVDFVQFNYRGPHSNTLRERFSVVAAFNLNNSGSRRLKIEELNLEKEWLEQEMALDQSRWNEALSRMKHSLQKDFAYYHYFTQVSQREEQYFDSLVSQLLSSSDFNPLHILDIKERQLQNELEKLQLARALYEQYLKYLFRSEIICSRPGLNFLS